MNYRVDKTRCRCHPEICKCKPWSVYDEMDQPVASLPTYSAARVYTKQLMFQPIVTLIWAMNHEGVIGNDNKLLWRCKKDMEWFKKSTLNRPVIMGSKTFASLNYKPLPDRYNIVMSQTQTFEGVTMARSPQEALDKVAEYPMSKKVMIIGGAEIYAMFLRHADFLYCTHVNNHLTGDTTFPRFNWSAWSPVSCTERPADKDNDYDMVFAIYERRAPV